MISKLSWLSVLVVFLAVVSCFSGSMLRPLELLDRGRGFVLGFEVVCSEAAVALATFGFALLICSLRSGKSVPLVFSNECNPRRHTYTPPPRL